MKLTLVATFCQLFTAHCEPVVITNSDYEPGLTAFSCMFAQPKIAMWQQVAPKYSSWRFTGWKCVPGEYEIARPL